MQVAHIAESTDTDHDAIEKQQCVPLCTGDPVEYVKRNDAAEAIECLLIAFLQGYCSLAFQGLGQCAAQKITEKL